MTVVWSGGVRWRNMDLLGLTAVLVCLTQTINGQTFRLMCPPPFPNMERFFSRTLQIQTKLQEFNKFKADAATPVNCTYSPRTMENIDDFNFVRCDGTDKIVMECPVPTTTPEPTTTTESTTTTTTRTIVTTSRRTTSAPSERTTRAGSTSSVAPPPIPSVVPSEPTQESTSGRGLTVTSLMPPQTTTDDNTHTGFVVQRGGEELTIVAISVGAGILAVIVIAVALLMCRRHLHAYSGAVDLHNKHEKAQRQRSDCRPISSISQNDTCEGSSKGGSPSSIRYNRGYVTNGRKWRPEYDGQSEDGESEKSGQSGKYVLLREDSSTSAYSFSTHYNTLRTIDHPHALILGGFGESSTDMTLPRRFREKLRQSQELQFLEGGIAETKFMTDPADKNANNIKPDVVCADDPVYDSIRSLSDFDTLVPVQNGHVRNGDIKRQGDADRHSLDTIDAADAVLDQPSVGVANAGFQAEDQEDEEAIKDWQSWVVDEISSHNPGSSDSLVNPRNEHLFAYDNKGLSGSFPSVKEEVIEPPPEFRDTSNSNEPTVAVVQPSVQSSKSPKPRSFLHGGAAADSANNKHLKPSSTRGSTNGPVVGKTAPFSYTPSPSSSLPRDEMLHTSLPRSSEISAPNGSVLTNGRLIVENGSLPHEGSDKGKKRTLLHDNSWIKGETEKPAAQVPPRVKEVH